MIDTSCSSSLRISAGPKEVLARGERTGGRELALERREDCWLGDDGACMTSALTTPKTCLTWPRTGVTIMGTSLRKSLPLLALVKHEYLGLGSVRLSVGVSERELD